MLSICVNENVENLIWIVFMTDNQPAMINTYDLLIQLLVPINAELELSLH